MFILDARFWTVLVLVIACAAALAALAGAALGGPWHHRHPRHRR
ncbi:hypothetical protein [Yinghuangia soli]|nr:hypothetical protein [Yinghuangia soli]